MKLFLILKKIFGGSAGLTLGSGTETETDSIRVVTTLNTGTETETDAMQVSASLNTGTETENMEISATGSAIFPQGTETEIDSLSLVTSLNTGTETETAAILISTTLNTGSETETDRLPLMTATIPTGSETETDVLTLSTSLNTGSESESFSVNAVADISQYTASAYAVQIAGVDNWATATNAQGAINGTEAVLSFAPVAQLLTEATLKCTLPSIGATPSGFTRSTINARIRQRWDLTIASPVLGVVDAINTITLRTNDGGSDTLLPSDFAGTQLWLKSESLAGDNNSIIQTWNDSSGKGNNVTQALLTKRPLLRLNAVNAQPGVVFDGVDDELIVALPAAMQVNSYTYFVVFQSNTASSVLVEFGNSATADQLLRIHASTSKAETISYRTGGPDTMSSTTSVRTAVTFFIVTVRRSTAENNLKIYVNGTLENTMTLGNATADYGTLPSIAIGSRNGSGFTNGIISEVFFIDSAITAAQITSLTNGLKNKFSSSLIATLNTRSAVGGAGTQATLITEDFVITPTDPQLAAGMQVWFNGKYNFVTINGNAGWNVDAAHLSVSYTKTGIV